MIDGALIGLVVGLTIAVVTWMQRSKRTKGFLTALEAEGPEAARGALDQQSPPVSDIPLKKILEQIDRMASLGIIGDTESLEREIESHTGKLTSVVQVNAMALMGLVARADDPTPYVERLEALADRIESEGGRTLGLVKRNTRAMAVVARGVMTGQTPMEHRQVVYKIANAQGDIVRALLAWVVARGFEAEGDEAKAAEYYARARKVTSGFDKPGLAEARNHPDTSAIQDTASEE